MKQYSRKRRSIDDKSRNKYLSKLGSGTKIEIKWHSNNKKESVDASSMLFVNDKEDVGSERRSSKRNR